MKKEYAQRTALLLGWDKVEALAGKTVLVFGVGGVGSFAAEALCRAGIGRLILVDGDVYDPSNLNRQLGATVPAIGRPKVEVMKERFLSINPDIAVETHHVFYLPAEQPGLVAQSGADYVVDAIDTVAAKIDIIAEAYEAGIPVISAMGAGNKLHPELFEIAEIEKTSVDPLAKVMRKELKKRNIRRVKVVYSKELPQPVRGEEGCSGIGSISFVPSAAGLILAGAVVRDLLQIP